MEPVQLGTVITTQMGFVTAFDNIGSRIVFSTPLGTTTGLNDFNAVAGDSAGNVYVAGEAFAAGYPVSTPPPSPPSAAFQGPSSIVASKISLASSCSFTVTPTDITLSYSSPPVTQISL